MGPPSAGGLTVGQVRGLRSRCDRPALGPTEPESWHLLAEASKLAFADCNLYMADSDFVTVPVGGLLDPAYLAARAALIDPRAAAPAPVAAGRPPGANGPNPAPRSEEHTSELQSLMRISYAVFCLKKKNNK